LSAIRGFLITVTDLSIITVCRDPSRPALERFLSSLRQYTSCAHELIVVDNAGTDTDSSAFLAAQCDSYVRLPERVGVAAAWNAAVTLARGEYLLTTNPDVIVGRGWFEQLQAVFQQHQRVGLVAPVMNYSGPAQTNLGQQKYLDNAGAVRAEPSKDVVSGAFALFSRDALVRVNTFSAAAEVENAEDLDVCSKLADAGLDSYVHQGVFVYNEWGAYHQRSTASQRPGVDPAAAPAGKALSIVTICLDPDAPILERFLSSVREFTTCDYELIIVDNAGEDHERSALMASSCDKYIRIPGRISVAEAWNRGIAKAEGRYVLVTNDDVVVPPNWFESMRQLFVDHDRTGMVAPVMNYSVPEQAHRGDIRHFDEADAVKLTRFRQFIWGAFMLFSRSSLERVNNFSEEFALAGGEDTDMCFKLFEAELDIYVDHRVFVYHEWGSTGNRLLGPERRMELYVANHEKVMQKWSRYTRAGDRPAGVAAATLARLGAVWRTLLGAGRR